MDRVLQQQIDKFIKENNDKITKYKTMFNMGNNDGDVIIICQDENIRVHSEVLESTSEYYRICKEIFDTDKIIYLRQFSSKVVKCLMIILYNSTDPVMYFEEWYLMCSFFELTEILLLDEILDEVLDEMYDDYLYHMKKGENVSGKKYANLFWIEILIYMNDAYNKYFNKLRTEIINMNLLNIKKSYGKHHKNILQNYDDMCNCFNGKIIHRDDENKGFICYEKINCIFDPYIIPKDTIKQMELMVFDSLAQ